jgi:hypothetical protein
MRIKNIVVRVRKTSVVNIFVIGFIFRPPFYTFFSYCKAKIIMRLKILTSNISVPSSKDNNKSLCIFNLPFVLF